MNGFNLIRDGLAIKGLLSIIKNKSNLEKHTQSIPQPSQLGRRSAIVNKDTLTAKERAEILKADIVKKQHELAAINAILMTAELDIRKRFVIWANNGQKKEQKTHLPDGHLRKWCDRHGILENGRGVINLMDYDDAFGLFGLGDKELLQYGCFNDAEELKYDDLFIAACDQMMRENIDSFEIDW